MILFNKFHVATSTSLAPPTGQSWRYISACNFWTVHRIFKNLVSLESLDHAEFNAPHDVNFRHDRFSAILKNVENAKKVSRVTIFDRLSWKLVYGIFGPIRTKVIRWIFDFRNRLTVTANRIRQKRHQTGSELISPQPFDVSLLNLVEYHYTTSQGDAPNLVQFGKKGAL